MAERTLRGYAGGRPDVVSPYRTNRRPTATPERTEFSKGMERGLRSLQGGLYGAAQQAGDVTGIDAVSDFGQEGYDRSQQALQDPALQLNQPDVTEINWKDPDQIVDWASGVIGQTIPYGASMLVGGGIGAKLAKRSPRTGAALGGVAATAPIESGNTYREILDESGVEAPGIAAGAGLLSAGLNVAAPATALSRNAVGGVASRVARKGAETSVVEAGTEALQESVNLGARSLADDTFNPLSEEELPDTQNRLINAAAGGAVGGGALGGATGLLPARRSRDPNETFESRYEKYLGPVDGPALSLTPEDAASPLNEAMTPIVDAYRAGEINRNTMLKNMDQIASQYELDPIIMADVGRRIDDIEATMVKDKDTKLLRLPKDDAEAGLQPLRLDPLNQQVADQDPDLEQETIDQTEADRVSLRVDERATEEENLGGTAGPIFSTATGFPWNETNYERAAQDYNEMFRSEEGDTLVAPETFSLLDKFDTPEAARSSKGMQRLQEENPGLDLEQVTMYELARSEFAEQGLSRDQIADKLDSVAIDLASRNNDKLTDYGRPAEYLRRQMAVQAVGRLPSAVAPLGSELSASDLTGRLSPAEQRARGRINKRFNELKTEVDAGRLSASDAEYMDLQNRRKQFRNKQNLGGIVKREPKNLEPSYLATKREGKTSWVDVPTLVQRMMRADDISIPENTPMNRRLQTYISEGLGELAAKGFDIPSKIPPNTVVFKGAEGRDYTYREVFGEEFLDRLPEGQRTMDVGRAQFRVERATSALHNHRNNKKKNPNEADIKAWNDKKNTLMQQYNDAISQLQVAQRDAAARRPEQIERRPSSEIPGNAQPQPGSFEARNDNRLRSQRGRREEFRDEDMVRDIERAERGEEYEGESIDNPATAAESGTVARTPQKRDAGPAPSNETDPAPIRRHSGPGDIEFLNIALEKTRNRIAKVDRELKKLTEPGSEISGDKLYALQLEIGKLVKHEAYLKDYKEFYLDPTTDERLNYAAGVQAAYDFEPVSYAQPEPADPNSTTARNKARDDRARQLQEETDGQVRSVAEADAIETASKYIDSNVAKSEAISSARSDTMADVERADTPNKRDRLFRSMQNTLERVGLQDTRVKVLSVKEAIAGFEAEGIRDAAAKIQNGSLHGATFGIGKNLQVFIHPKLQGRVRDEIIAHEFGHVLYRTMIDAASPTMRLALTNDFKRWASKYGDSTVDSLLRSKKLGNAAMLYSVQGMGGRSVKELGENAQAYLLNFEEWMADRVSREIMSNSRPKGPVRQFFSDLIDKIKQIAARLGLLESSVSDFMRPLVTRPDTFSTLFDDLINPINFVDGPFELTRQNAASMLAAARTTLTDTYSRTSEQAIDYVISQMPKDTRDAVNMAVSKAAGVRNQVSKYGDITAGKAYQLWRRGKLSAGPKLEDAFKRMTQGLDDLNTANLNSDVASEVDRMLDVPNKAAFSEIQQELQGNYQAIEPQRSYVDKAINGAKSTFFIVDERLRATKIPALQELANMLHKKVGQKVPENTMQTDKQIVKGRFDARARQIFEGKSEEFGDEVLRVMYRPELKEGADPEVKDAANKLFGLMRYVRDYLTESGVELGNRGPDYFPWVVDLDAMTKENVNHLEQVINRPEYQSAMEKELERVNASRRKQNIREIPMQQFKEEIVSTMSTNDGYVDSLPLENGADQNPVSPTPYMRSMNRRVLGFLQDIGTPEDREFMASLMQEDMGMVLSNYFSQAVKRGEYAKRFGDDKLDKILAKAKEQGAKDEDIDLAVDYINATMGLHGRDTALWLHSKTGLPMPESGQPINQDVLRGMGSVMVYQNFRTLAGATFTSLADFMGIGVRTGSISEAFIAMKDGFRSMVINQGNDDLSVIAETLGIIDYGVVNEALGWEYGGAYLTGTARKLNEGFFKWIGLQSWTRASRVMGTSAAMRFLGKHATKPGRHSTRFLEDLGLTADDVVVDDRGTARVLTYSERNAATPEELARDDRVRSAIVNFVDESILRPNPSMRPLWASDPHYMLVFHLKSFMYAFHDRILKRVYNEGVEHGNFAPLAGLMGYIPVMIAADLVRDLVMNGGEEDPQKANWGMWDYAKDGAFRAGLPGVPGLIGYDIMRDYRYSGIPGVSLLGPTAEQLINPPEFNEWLPGQQVIPDLEF